MTGSATVELDGFFSLGGGALGSGGTSLTIGGKLTNSTTDSFGLTIGNFGITSADTLTVDGPGGLSNGSTSEIVINGSATAQATLDIADAAAGFGTKGVETGAVSLDNDALLEFKSGQITTINGELQLNGAGAHVADAGATGSSSALTGLASVTDEFFFENGATVATTGALTNSGTIELNSGNAEGGSSLTIGGGLTNDGTIEIGPSNDTLSAADKVHAASVNNSGTIDVYGNATNSIDASLTMPGSFTNNGTVNFSDDVDTITGAVSGTTGNFGLSNGSTLTFVAGVSNGETVTFGSGAADLLNLDLAQSFDATNEDFFTVGDAVEPYELRPQREYFLVHPDGCGQRLVDGDGRHEKGCHRLCRRAVHEERFLDPVG